MKANSLLLSEREMLLLKAALSPHAEVAARSWEDWATTSALEDAPSPELRLLPAVVANLKQVAPTFELPKKAHGLAKATFAKSRHLVFCSSEIIDELSRFCPVLVTKGLAMLIRFDAWSSRPMADIDIHVPTSALGGALEILGRSGWQPCYGMTFGSLLHRSSLRRESWNFIKGSGNLDLHWRLPASHMDRDLESKMWESAEPVEFAGRKLLIQSPEYALVTGLHHGFLRGHHSDRLQSIVDAAWLLPLCRDDALSRLMHKARLLNEGRQLLEYLRTFGFSGRIPALARLDNGPAEQASVAPPPIETALLNRPALYRLWNSLGRKSRIERLLLKWNGPFSKPLRPGAPKSEYDLRDCAAIDEIAGPGWTWREPNSSFWTDRADARLLVPLSRVADHLIVVTFDQQYSLNAHIEVFANGRFVMRKHHMERLADGACCLMIPRRLLLGPWVELSFRPNPYIGETGVQATALGAPARRLRVLDLRHVTEVFSGHEVPQLYVRLFKGEEPYSSKVARIKAKAENSSYKSASELPPDFDPLLYVLSYPDLFEHEVDPYEHFLNHGRHEDRAWR